MSHTRHTLHNFMKHTGYKCSQRSAALKAKTIKIRTKEKRLTLNKIHEASCFQLSFQVVDFVKAVNCTFTLGVFTKWDLFRGNNFSEEYGDTTTEDIKERCFREFMNAVSDRGQVYFVDSHSQREARNHFFNQVKFVVSIVVATKTLSTKYYFAHCPNLEYTVLHHRSPKHSMTLAFNRKLNNNLLASRTYNIITPNVSCWIFMASRSSRATF